MRRGQLAEHPRELGPIERLRLVSARISRHSVIRFGLAASFPRVVAIGTAVVLTPLGIRSLGPASFGIWVLATQIPSLIVSPDLGMGQGITNELVAEHRESGNLRNFAGRLTGMQRILRAVALSWFAVGSVVALLYAIFGTDRSNAWEVFWALILSLGCELIGVPATIWRRAQLAQERGHIGMLWDGLGQSATLIACLVVLALHPSVLLLTVADVLPPALVLWPNAWFFKRRELKRVAVAPPSLRASYAMNRKAIRIGGIFFCLQICYVFSTAIDPYLINTFRGSVGVTYVTTVRRPFDLIGVAIGLFSTALWPVYSRLILQRRLKALRLFTVGPALVGAVGACLFGSLMIVLRGPIYDVVGSGQVHPSVADLVYATLMAAGGACMLVMTMYLNSANLLRVQLAIAILGTSLGFGLKLWALSEFGVHTYFAVGALVYLCAVAGPTALVVGKDLLRLHRSRDEVIPI